MKRSIKKVVLLALMLVVMGTVLSASAQSQGFVNATPQTRGAYVGGTVTRDNGLTQPVVPNATVEIWLQPKNKNFSPLHIATVKTNQNGWYEYYIDPKLFPIEDYETIIVHLPGANSAGSGNSAKYVYGVIVLNLRFGIPW